MKTGNRIAGFVAVSLVIVRAALGSDPERIPGAYVAALGHAGRDSAADFDGDGRLDVALAGSTSKPTDGYVRVAWGDGFGTFESFTPVAIGTPLVLIDVWTRIAAADLDNDGDSDIVVVSSDPAALFVLENTGARTFAPASGFAFVPPTGSALPMNVALGDVDGNGLVDLVVSSLQYASVRCNLGNLAFGAPLWITQPGNFATIALGDLNGDGRADLCATSVAWTLNVHLNDGTGQFLAPTTYATSTGPVPAATIPAVGDLDMDGLDDVAVVGVNSAILDVFFATAGGTLSAKQSFPTAETPRFPAIRDADGDGDRDVVFAFADDVGGGISVVPTIGPATLGLQVNSHPATFGAQSLALGDMDGDLLLDVILTSDNDGIGVFRGLGGGAFERLTLLPTTAIGQHGVVRGDVNLDGHQDLVTQCTGAGTPIETYFGNGDGTFGAPILTPSSGASGADTVDVADLDNDGFLDALSRPAAGLVWRKGDGTGSFGPEILLQWAPGIPRIDDALADLDLDGDVDIVSVGIPNGFAVTPNMGNGTFGFLTFFSNGKATRIKVGNANGDAAPDVYFGTGAAVSIWVGNGSLSFTGIPGNSMSLPFAETFCVGDVDGDGRDDAVAADFKFTEAIAVKRSGSTPPFQVTKTTAAPGQDECELLVHDYDGDGLGDVVVSEYLRTRVFQSFGAGNLREWFSFPTAVSDSLGIAVGDFDEDGQGDLAIAGYGYPLHSLVVVNSGCPGAAGTFGSGCAGSGGFVPHLALQGCRAAAGQSLTLAIDDALGGSFGILLFGASAETSPLPNGCSLHLGLLLPASVVLPLTGGGFGQGTLAAPLVVPPSVSTATVFMQAFMADPGVAGGFTVTQALRVDVQ